MVATEPTLEAIVAVAAVFVEVLGADARAAAIDVHRVRGDLWVEVLTRDPDRFVGPRRATAERLRAQLAERLDEPRVRLNIHLEPRANMIPGFASAYLANNGLFRHIARLDVREEPVSLFHPDDYIGYGLRPLPDASDDEVGELLATVDSPASYAAVDTELSDLDRRVLRAFAARMATLAVRRSDDGVLVDALVALCLAGLAIGDRDAMVVSVLPYRAAELIGVPPEACYRQAAATGRRRCGSTTAPATPSTRSSPAPTSASRSWATGRPRSWTASPSSARPENCRMIATLTSRPGDGVRGRKKVGSVQPGGETRPRRALRAVTAMSVVVGGVSVALVPGDGGRCHRVGGGSALLVVGTVPA